MIISQARSLWVTLQLQISQVITTYHYKKKVKQINIQN